MKEFLVAALCAVISCFATASPTLTAKQAGSSILFHVVNNEDREYGCSITWSVIWNDFGKSGGNTLNRAVVVRAKQNGLLMQDNSAHSNFKLTDFNYNCS